MATFSDMYSGVTAAIGALKDHFMVVQMKQVMKMLMEIGSLENVETYIHE